MECVKVLVFDPSETFAHRGLHFGLECDRLVAHEPAPPLHLGVEPDTAPAIATIGSI